MLEELAKGLWKSNGKLSRAACNSAYRARLQHETPAPAKNSTMEELMTKTVPMPLDGRVPSWRGEKVSVKDQQSRFRGLSRQFSSWGAQGHGLRHSQQWNSCIFSRSFASLDGKVHRRKRDLARREFELLRRKTKLLKATLSPEERLLWRLKKANRKRAVLLQRLKKYELEEDPEPVHDPELITAEQLEALKKIGYKNRNYVPVGRRGVYGGVVQNMHMHWKFHETVQIDCHIFKREDIRSVARQLAILSGGVVIDIHQATNIIMYRGRNYRQPKKQMIPPNTLSKRKALFKSKFLQALDSLETTIKSIEAELQVVRRKQKQSAEQGAEAGTSKPPQVASNQGEDKELLVKLSEVSGDDLHDEDDGLFSWDTDGLDEEELSDDDGTDSESEEVQEKVAKPISRKSVDPVAQVGKKKRPTAKELILLEQELFSNRRQADKAKELILAEQDLFRNRRQADTKQKVGSTSVQSDRSINCKNVDMEGSVNDEDNDFEKGGLIEDSSRHGLWSSEDDGGDEDVRKPEIVSTEKRREKTKNMKKAQGLGGSITDTEEEKEDFDSEFADLAERNQGKAHEQIKNKKIAEFMEGFITDSEEETHQPDSDFDDLDGPN